MTPLAPPSACRNAPTVRIVRITNTQDEHRAARELLRTTVAQCFDCQGFEPVVDSGGRPRWDDGICWSVTHAFPWVAVAVSEKPIGIDLEVCRGRDPALFSLFTEKEWAILGQRDWCAFYRLWTAKEALIKRERLTLDALPRMELVARRENDLLLQYNGKRIPTRGTVTADYICSLTLR